jgi:hypothetical protein
MLIQGGSYALKNEVSQGLWGAEEDPFWTPETVESQSMEELRVSSFWNQFLVVPKRLYLSRVMEP